MAMADPNTIAQKWSQRLGGSTDEIRRGVQAVTKAPGQAAADAADLWLMKVSQSRDKFRTNSAKVTLADWQSAMLDKGVQRVAQGATAGIPKMANFMADFLPHLEAGQRIVASMPKGTVEDSIQRAAAMIRHNANFKRR